MQVLIIIGSRSDLHVAEKTSELLKEFGVEHKITVASAHRTPHRIKDIVENSTAEIFIAVAGLSAALPGAVAAYTTKPVIGVPVSGKLNLDAILSIVQMPKGVPVAAVGLDMGENAALLAVEILALKDINLANTLKNYRRKLAEKTFKDEKGIR